MSFAVVDRESICITIEVFNVRTIRRVNCLHLHSRKCHMYPGIVNGDDGSHV